MAVINSNLESALATFGLASFRPGQREVIETIVAGEDCTCVMPTGGGKSLCYQLPSIVRPGLTIVVSPLIALMKDQVDSLTKLGIAAALINSTLSSSEQQTRLQAVTAGKYQLVYVAPERLRNTRFLEAIRATPIQLLAVDEAHCISQWGHDFRPDYARIGQFRDLLGGVQTVALTATATPRVRDDIVEVLRLKRPKQFMSGFARPNLHFGVVQRKGDREKESELENFLRNVEGAGIIYSATRKRCEAIAEMISKKLKISVGVYHAGLMMDQRRAIQERFMNSELRVIVATNAFGMGIDKSDLRFVIHYNMPGSLEAYYQEAGRAGRDGQQSVCVMLYTFQDRHIQEFFIDNRYPDRSLIEKVYDFCVRQDDDPIELTLEEIRDALGLGVSPEAIGSCLQILGRTRVLERLEMGSGLAMIKIDSKLPTLVDLLPREAKVQRSVMRVLERLVGERRGEYVSVHPRQLLQESGLQRDPLGRAMRELTKLAAVDYIRPFRGRAVHVVRRNVAFDDLGIDFENIRERKQTEYDRLNQVVNYAQSPLCRQATILNYFGDPKAENCGQCDRCGRSPGWPKLTTTRSQSSEEQKPTAITDERADGSAASDDEVQVLTQVVESIGRIHGRLGKHLLSQYLCGSQNAKVQKLNLHRLSGFGMLKGFRLGDGVELIEALLSAGVLRQQEVNRNRPTISVAPEMTDTSKQPQLLSAVPMTGALRQKMKPLVHALVGQPKSTSAARIGQQDTTAPKNTTAPKSLPEHHLSSSSDPERDAAEEQLGTAAVAPDWRWTTMLFEQGLRWQDITKVRRMSDDELSDSLCAALRASAEVDRSWLTPNNDVPPSPGQRRVVRELARRVAAGVR